MTILLSITGDPGVHVQGRCTADPASETAQIDAAVPYEQSFEATALRCAFEAER